jgi:hypothetical protein
VDGGGTGGLSLSLSLLGDFCLLMDRSIGCSSAELLGNLLEVEGEIMAVEESEGGSCVVVEGR